MMKFSNSKILIFARSPIIGAVKKRLIPTLGPKGAFIFHKKCIQYTLEKRCKSDIAPVLLYITSRGSKNFFSKIVRDFPVNIFYQKGNNLGERMYHAAKEQIIDTTSIILIGTDAPALKNQDIETALLKLSNQCDIVMQPAEDGGYVLLGMKKIYKKLFIDIPWGTSAVADITRDRCKELGVKLIELSECWDIDRPSDLKRLNALKDFNEFID